MTPAPGLGCALLLLMSLPACALGPVPHVPAPSRLESIPVASVKVTPAADLNPPKSLTSSYADPVPLPYPVNTAGAEDSAFVMPDGDTLYFWFTPDLGVPVQRQLTDRVTGIYVTHLSGSAWSSPQRVVLEAPGELALDGCEFVLGDTMWFCSTRAGYDGVNWFTAMFVASIWTSWKNAEFPPDFEVGELHISADGNQLYFHSSRPGGQGGYDIWVSHKADGAWAEPVNVAAVNSAFSDGWPFLSQDGSQLWFTRIEGAPTLWRSVLTDGQWSQPSRMFGPFAGEASLDNHGNVYFTHHFYADGRMIEADIYVAHPGTR